MTRKGKGKEKASNASVSAPRAFTFGGQDISEEILDLYTRWKINESRKRLKEDTENFQADKLSTIRSGAVFVVTPSIGESGNIGTEEAKQLINGQKQNHA